MYLKNVNLVCSRDVFSQIPVLIWILRKEKTSSSPEFDLCITSQKRVFVQVWGHKNLKPLCLGLTLQTQELDHTDNYSYSLRLSLG